VVGCAAKGMNYCSALGISDQGGKVPRDHGICSSAIVVLVVMSLTTGTPLPQSRKRPRGQDDKLFCYYFDAWPNSTFSHFTNGSVVSGLCQAVMGSVCIRLRMCHVEHTSRLWLFVQSLSEKSIATVVSTETAQCNTNQKSR
jgi:hypothetical protein